MVAMYKGCVLSTCRLRKSKTTAQRTSAVSVPDTRWQAVASSHNHAWTEKLTPSQDFQAVPGNCEWKFNTTTLCYQGFSLVPLCLQTTWAKTGLDCYRQDNKLPPFVFHAHMLRDSAGFWRCRYMGSAHIGRNCTSLRRTLTRIALPRKLPHPRALENTKAHKKDKNPAWRSASTLSFAWITNFKSSLDKPLAAWKHRLTHLCVHASIHPCIFVSMHPFIMHPCIQHAKGAGSVAGLQQTGTFAESILLLFLRRPDCLLRLFSLRFQVIQLVAQQFLTTDSRNVGNEMWQGSLIAGTTLVHRPVPDSILALPQWNGC